MYSISDAYYNDFLPYDSFDYSEIPTPVSRPWQKRALSDASSVRGIYINPCSPNKLQLPEDLPSRPHQPLRRCHSGYGPSRSPLATLSAPVYATSVRRKRAFARKLSSCEEAGRAMSAGGAECGSVDSENGGEELKIIIASASTPSSKASSSIIHHV